MAFQALSVPTLQVNGKTINIVPNTFMYDAGEGEITVRAASAGGNSSESVHTQNAEGKIAKVKFSLFVKGDIDGDIAEWKQNIGTNEIIAVQQFIGQDAVTKTFPGASITNMVEREATADGAVALEWAGDPMVTT